MDVFGIVYIIENAQQFWSELDDILQVPPDATLTELDAALKRFVAFCATYHEQFLQTPVQLEHACNLLLGSELFTFHSERMSDCLLNDGRTATDPHQQLILYKILLLYGRAHPNFLRSQKKWQPLLPLLMDHVLLDFEPDVEDNYAGSVSSTGWSRAMVIPIEARLRLLSISILYEVCRVQKFSVVDLQLFDDAFIAHLFELVEQTRHMQDETLNYSVIKLIVALNEQFMVASLRPTSPSSATHGQFKITHGHSPSPPSEDHNRVLQVLMRRLGSSKTFGENMIFMLNRANRTPEDLCMQLLVLKILYLLFTTKGTSEYFYTNDLCVLVDVFLRELVDLDEESEALRHTYLRVLHPLLTRTQLRSLPYKRAHIARILESLTSHAGIRDISPTTRRLVSRCLAGEWAAHLRSQASTPGSECDRTASPSADSVRSESAVRAEMLAPPSAVRPKTLKACRSAENIAAPRPRSASTHNPEVPRRQDTQTSMQNVAAALPASTSLPPVGSTPTQRRRASGAGHHAPAAASVHSAPPTTTSAVGVSVVGRHPGGMVSLGTVADSLVVAPKKAGTGHDRRAPPPTPPKRRKPPAIPVGRTARGATITTIASSAATPSPLSRVTPIMPS